MGTLTDSIIIEDEDGFRTSWPFPEASSLLHQADYIELCEALHDELREKK